MNIDEMVNDFGESLNNKNIKSKNKRPHLDPQHVYVNIGCDLSMFNVTEEHKYTIKYMIVYIQNYAPNIDFVSVLDKNVLNNFISHMRATIFSWTTIDKVENFVHQFLINNLPLTILNFKKEITHNTYNCDDFPHNYKNYIDFINNYIYDAYKLRETL